MTTINIDPYKNYQLKDNLTIDSDIFGKVVFSYTIINIKTKKLLRYKIQNYPEVFMVDYNIIEEKITLHEYFRNTLKFLNIQLKEFKENDKIQEFMKDEEKELLYYFNELNKNYLKNKK